MTAVFVPCTRKHRAWIALPPDAERVSPPCPRAPPRRSGALVRASVSALGPSSAPMSGSRRSQSLRSQQSFEVLADGLFQLTGLRYDPVVIHRPKSFQLPGQGRPIGAANPSTRGDPRRLSGRAAGGAGSANWSCGASSSLWPDGGRQKEVGYSRTVPGGKRTLLGTRRSWVATAVSPAPDGFSQRSQSTPASRRCQGSGRPQSSGQVCTGSLVCMCST